MKFSKGRSVVGRSVASWSSIFILLTLISVSAHGSLVKRVEISSTKQPANPSLLEHGRYNNACVCALRFLKHTVWYDLRSPDVATGLDHLYSIQAAWSNSIHLRRSNTTAGADMMPLDVNRNDRMQYPTRLQCRRVCIIK